MLCRLSEVSSVFQSNITREIALQAYVQLAYRHRTVVYALNDKLFYRFTFTKNRATKIIDVTCKY